MRPNNFGLMIDTPLFQQVCQLGITPACETSAPATNPRRPRPLLRRPHGGLNRQTLAAQTDCHWAVILANAVGSARLDDREGM